MPETIEELAERIWSLKVEGDKNVCYLERVWAIPRAGVSMGAQTSFRFGEQFGACQGILHAVGFEVVLVAPVSWQKTTPGIKSGKRPGEKKTEWKRRLATLARKLNKSIRVTAKTADALLILEHGKREETKFEGE